MANSDNVLRCGLTPKHVDVDEVVAVTDFTPLAEPRCPVRQGRGGGVEFEVPVPDFGLTLVDLDADDGRCEVDGQGPYLVLCADGAVRVEAAGTAVVTGPGRAAFVRARAAPFTLSGTGQAFLATTRRLDQQI
jgi:mannose-6-phosphate isomerase